MVATMDSEGYVNVFAPALGLAGTHTLGSREVVRTHYSQVPLSQRERSPPMRRRRLGGTGWVQSLGVWVWGLELRIQGSGFRVKGKGFRDEGMGRRGEG